MKKEWENKVLSEICTFSSYRTEVKKLNKTNYVSTENLLPNKSGKTDASAIPTKGQVIEIRPNMTLISNIRPYFKKIYFSESYGGCSNDVLAFVPKDNISAKWLYYLLSNDSFFDYVMSGTKGTKMPRGDKSQIMNYPICLPKKEDQIKMVRVLDSLENKIRYNTLINQNLDWEDYFRICRRIYELEKENQNLEAQAQAIFKSWFIDFEPFKNGKFIDSELGRIPEGWKVVLLSNIANFEKGKKPKTTFENGNDGVIPYLTIEALSGGNVTYCETEKMVLAKENEILLVMDGASSGTLFYGMEGAVASTIAKLNSSDISLQEIIFEFISYRQEDLKSHNTGSAIPHLDKTYLLSYKMVIPSDKTLLLKVSSWLKTLRAKIIQNKKESQRLAQLRDTLLPKLMSGEIDVSDVAV